MSEFLTSVGAPEVDALDERIEKLKREISHTVPEQSDEDVDEFKNEEASSFSARDEISNLFTKFAQEFTDTNKQKGVELNWLGIGVWKTPDEIIPGKNVEAWRLSKENAEKRMAEKLNTSQEEEISAELLKQIQKVPLASSKLGGLLGAYRSNMTREVLFDYRGLLKDALRLSPEYADEENKNIDEELNAAINIITKNLDKEKKQSGHYLSSSFEASLG